MSGRAHPLIKYITPSITVKGRKAADARHARFRTVLEACRAAGLTPPAEVVSYFGGREPAALLVVDVTVTEEDGATVVDVEDIPDGVRSLVISGS